MTLVRKVNISIILCVTVSGVALCLAHWVIERRAAHRALEDDGRAMVRTLAAQIANLKPAPNVANVQHIVDQACQWRSDILVLRYYSLQTDDEGSPSFRFLAGSLVESAEAQPPVLACDAVRKGRLLLKRRYHESTPHIAVSVPVLAKGGDAGAEPKILGVIYLMLSPNEVMRGVIRNAQRMVNSWLLIGPLTMLLLIFIVRFLIIGRVEVLARATESGVRRELEQLGGPEPSDEIGRLARNINHMFRSLLTRNAVWERLYTASIQERDQPPGPTDVDEDIPPSSRDRLEHELEIANRIQLSLLPERFPEGHGLSFAVRYAPAGKVGGDLYDFVVVNPDMLGIMIADVAGHGIPAAFVAGMTKIAFTQFALENPSPKQVVSAINDYLYGHLRTGHYVTLFYGIFNRTTKTFRFVRAGHQAPVVIRKDSNIIEMLETGGPLVGAAAKVSFEEGEITLRSGDMIVLLTDGLAECKSEQGYRLGQSGVRQTLQNLSAKTPEAAAAEIFRKAAEFRGSVAPEDDITILVAQVQDGEVPASPSADLQ